MVLPRVKMFEKGISAFLFKKITGSGAINFETRQLFKAFQIIFQLQICQKSLIYFKMWRLATGGDTAANEKRGGATLMAQWKVNVIGNAGVIFALESWNGHVRPMKIRPNAQIGREKGSGRMRKPNPITKMMAAVWPAAE